MRTGNLLFDGLYALAVSEACSNSVSSIHDDAYGKGAAISIEAFQTGELWTYVWTRDLSYSLDLGLAGFDPRRGASSLFFKSSGPKPSVTSVNGFQAVQDTGSGGSYPVSTDRVVWALGADAVLNHLDGKERAGFLKRAYPILCGTIEQDRKLVFDPEDGLYRGEQSFLDWREQTYPGWTKENTLPIAMSKSLSVNVLDYNLLKTAARWSGQLGFPEREARYEAWAASLKEAVNKRFFDEKSGLYVTYLLSDDGAPGIATRRHDLLGESLAVLLDVADGERSASLLRNYPTGPYGPPVVWPQERSVPIYHNQAIWPFVTAYWTKAARKVGNATAVDEGIASLMRLSADQHSNMENCDFLTGRIKVVDGPRKGPVINSPRQLWSVAGYLSMVQDVVFGQEVSSEGIRFRPFVTSTMRDALFKGSDLLKLEDLPYLGTTNSVRIHLPRGKISADGVCRIDRSELNGKPAGEGFVAASRLESRNVWDIFLEPPAPGKPVQAPRNADISDERSLFGPASPHWEGAGVSVDAGKVTLHYSHELPAAVTFTIYRDGLPVATGIRETSWTDPSSEGDGAVHSYVLEAVDARSGTVSHLTESRSSRSKEQETVLPASGMTNTGGNLAGGHHFENWGMPGHELLTGTFTIPKTGRYHVRTEFSNGAGPINTGITCAVKKVEVLRADNGAVAASGYAVMPQSGDWTRFELSSPLRADLESGREYQVRLSEDDSSRNMSYFASNERYTRAPGGGDSTFNFVNVAGVHLLYVSPPAK